MPAPSNIVWGPEVSGYCRIGISVTLTVNQTTVDRTVEVWFWSKYSAKDSNNTFYYDCGTDVKEAKTSKGSVSINTTVDSGAGWSTSNQQLLQSYEYQYQRGTSDQVYKIYAKLSNIGVASGSLYANTTFTIPALSSYTLSFNANGGSVSETSRTLFYGYQYGDLPTPTRTGYTFTGWYTQQSGGTQVYNTTTMGSSNVTVYAHWRANTLTINYHINGGTISSNKYYSSNSIVYDGGTKQILNDIRTYNNAETWGLYDAATFGLSRQGYKFLGWKVDSNGTTIFEENGVDIKPTDLTSDINTGNCKITMYAVWEIMGVMRIKQNNAWKTGITWIKTKSGWKLGIPYKKINGVWKQGGI